MRKQHKLRVMPALLLVLLLPALILQAAPFPPPLSPERPLSDGVLHVAAGAQTSPVVASNGQIALAAWVDNRTGRSRIYATRINAAGRVLDPAGIVLSTDPFAVVRAVVWNGTHFAAVVNREGQWSLVFVAPDGSTLGGTRLLDVPNQYEWADASDGGAGVRLLFVTVGEHPRAAVVDGDGDVIALDVALTEGEEHATKVVAGSRGSEFLVLLRAQGEASPDRTVSVRIGGEGRVLSSRDSGLLMEIDERTALEGGASGWLLARQYWAEPRVTVQRLDALGVADGLPLILHHAHPEDQRTQYQPRIVRENGGYTVMWHSSRTSGRSFTYGAFVPDQGTPGTPRQLQEWLGVTASVAVTSTAGQRLLLTSVYRAGTASSTDVFAQAVSDFLTVTSPFSLAYSTTEQWRVAVAAGRNGYLAAWVERGPDAFERVMIRRVLPDGTPAGSDAEVMSVPLGSNIEDTGIVSSGTHYLLTWRVGNTAYGLRVAAESGLLLDDAPFTIATALRLAVASNGTDAVAVWSSYTGDLQSRRIRMTGDPLAEPVVTLAQPSEATEVAIASNGSDYLVAWNDGYTDCMITCIGYIPAEVRALRLRADATKIDAGPLVLLALEEDVQSVKPAVAWNGGRYLVAWTTRPPGADVEGALVSTEGAVFERRVPLANIVSGRVVSIRVVAHRDQFVLFSNEYRTVEPTLAVYLSWTGVSFDARGSLEGVAALPRTLLAEDSVETLSAASSGSTMLVAYDRISGPEEGNVSRVYARLFGAFGSRRRAVR
jgi:hypothetical protein